MLQIAVSGPGSPLGPSLQQQQQQQQQEETSRKSDILESTSHELRLEKSNILMLGPTGSGKCKLAHTLCSFELNTGRMALNSEKVVLS